METVGAGFFFFDTEREKRGATSHPTPSLLATTPAHHHHVRPHAPCLPRPHLRPPPPGRGHGGHAPAQGGPRRGAGIQGQDQAGAAGDDQGDGGLDGPGADSL